MQNTVDPLNEDAVPYTSREDTINAVCSVIRESCNMEVASVDIQFAYRLRLVCGESLPLLVSFHSFSLRIKVVKSRCPRQQLLNHGDKIFINDHLRPILI